MEAFELGWAPVGKPFMTVHAYLAGTVLVDTGLAHAKKAMLELLAGRRVDVVLLTHHHEDHSGNARALKDGLGVPVLGNPQTVEKMRRGFRILPYQHYAWGRADPVEMEPLPEVVEVGDLRLEPFHTPGHSRDHTVYWVPSLGCLFSGDLYLADRVKYFRADERFGDQIRSLEKIAALDVEMLLCGHHPHVHGGAERLRAKLQFMQDFRGRVARAHRNGDDPATIMRRLGLTEARKVWWFSMGNVGMRHMVRSAIESLSENG